VPLVIFELTVLWLLQRRIALNRDVPVLRRYSRRRCGNWGDSSGRPGERRDP
jgi:hypothetical protein